MYSDHDTAELQTLRLTDLQQGSPHTREQLLVVCAEEGFFYLEVDPDSAIGNGMEYLLDFSKKLFDVPDEEKKRYYFRTTGRPSTSGFKFEGTETGAFGTPDGFELYMLPYNELMIRDYSQKLLCPQVVEHEQVTMASLTGAYHRVGLLILEQLSKALGLPHVENLAKAHDPLIPSTSSMSFLKYPAYGEGMKGGHVSHTDIGTLTFLYSLVDGLQIFHPSTEKWLWVKPRRGSLVVNVGDSLSLLTKMRLKSSLHRVIPHPNAQDKTRYSYAYFLRPNEMVTIEMTNGQKLKSIDWHWRKLEVFAAPLATQNEQNDVLCGKF